jgi:hypothetical protein
MNKFKRIGSIMINTSLIQRITRDSQRCVLVVRDNHLETDTQYTWERGTVEYRDVTELEKLLELRKACSLREHR